MRRRVLTGWRGCRSFPEAIEGAEGWAGEGGSKKEAEQQAAQIGLESWMQETLTPPV